MTPLTKKLDQSVDQWKCGSVMSWLSRPVHKVIMGPIRCDHIDASPFSNAMCVIKMLVRPKKTSNQVIQDNLSSFDGKSL